MTTNANRAKLKVSSEQALKYLYWVPHNKFIEARDNYWNVDNEGNVKAQSALWLYCWAKTGLNSEHVARQVKGIFDKIMNISFEEFDKMVPHEWARKMRKHEGDIEAEFAAYFS